jgi:hypothetical protein
MALVSPPDKHHESFLAAARKLLEAIGEATALGPALRFASVVLAVLGYYARDEDQGLRLKTLELGLLEAAEGPRAGSADAPELLRLFLLGAELVSAPPSEVLERASVFLPAVEHLVREDQGLRRNVALDVGALAVRDQRAPLFPLNGLCHIDFACNLARFALWSPSDGRAFDVSEENVLLLSRSWFHFIASGPLMLTGQARRPLASCARQSLSAVASALEVRGLDGGPLIWRADAKSAVARILDVIALADVDCGAGRIALLSWDLLLWIAESSAGPLLRAKIDRHRCWAYDRAVEAARLEGAKRARDAAIIRCASSKDAPKRRRR